LHFADNRRACFHWLELRGQTVQPEVNGVGASDATSDIKPVPHRGGISIEFGIVFHIVITTALFEFDRHRVSFGKLVQFYGYARFHAPGIFDAT
jgi:hypothetical protein